MRVVFPPEVGTAIDNYSMQSVIGECNVAVAIGCVTHHYRVRAASESNTLHKHSMLIHKHAALYRHALEILNKLESKKHEHILKFKHVFAVGVLYTDMEMLNRCMDKNPMIVLETLETMLTEPIVWEIFDDLTLRSEAIKKVLFIIEHIGTHIMDNLDVKDSVIAKMASVLNLVEAKFG
jgi:hypothetical protein